MIGAVILSEAKDVFSSAALESRSFASLRMTVQIAYDQSAAMDSQLARWFLKRGGYMDLKLKTISKDGIAEALSKVELYRYLNEPEEAESICHDILVADPENQIAQRLLGLTITDQFEGRRQTATAKPRKCFRTFPILTNASTISDCFRSVGRRRRCGRGVQRRC